MGAASTDERSRSKDAPGRFAYLNTQTPVPILLPGPSRSPEDGEVCALMKILAVTGMLTISKKQVFSNHYTTVPRNQVVCKGINPARPKIAIRQLPGRIFLRPGVASLLRFRAEAYSYPSQTCGGTSPPSGMDSDLEAFSHYPADGSFAALPGRTAAQTNYLNQRFLSY